MKSRHVYKKAQLIYGSKNNVQVWIWRLAPEMFCKGLFIENHIDDLAAPLTPILKFGPDFIEQVSF
jgi:hypothetical protein